MSTDKKEHLMASVGLMFVSAFSFTCSGFFGKHGAEHVDYWLTLFMRFAFPFVLLVCVEAFRCRVPPCRPDQVQVLRAFSLVMSQGLFFIAAVKTSLFLAMILYNTGPIFTILIDARRKRHLSMHALLAAVLGFSGVLLTLWGGLRHANVFVFVGLASGVFLAISQLSLYASAKNKTHFETMFYTYGLGVLFLLPALVIVWYERGLCMPIAFTYTSLASLLFVGLFSMGNQYYRSLAYARVNDIQIVSPLIYAT